MSKNLKPQVPGEIPGVDRTALAAILDASVADVAVGLDTLSDSELLVLAELEMAGASRKGVAQAIAAEQARREGAPDEPEVKQANPIGDAESYAHKHWHEVDASKLVRPVLTLDGWLNPLPSAKPQE